MCWLPHRPADAPGFRQNEAPARGTWGRTEVIDRTKKRRIYAREGVAHLWFVSPERNKMRRIYAREGVGHLWFVSPERREAKALGRGRLPTGP
jgi:Uma2 family endonuclease